MADYLSSIKTILSSCMSGSGLVALGTKPETSGSMLAINYNVISEVPAYDQNQSKLADTARIQIDIWGSNFKKVKSLKETVAQQLNFNCSNFLTSYPDSSFSVKDEETKLWRWSLDYIILN
jgi:hypothetical protein